MDTSRRLWPRADLRVGDADRQAVVDELQRHYVEGRLTSEELGERVSQALGARTFGDLANLLSDLPTLPDPNALVPAVHHDHSEWHTQTTSPPIGALLLVLGLLAMVFMFAMPLGHFGLFAFPWPLLIWGFFIIGRPGGRRRF